jgi:DNA-directed RNA polymerase specialized sigma24 family protein
MKGQEAPRQPDKLLLPFLRATDETESQRHLEELIDRHAKPVIERIIQRKLGAFPPRAGSRSQGQDERDAEDVHAEAVAELLTQLRLFKTDPEGEAIANFGAYVTVTTYHVFDRHLRQKYPQRSRLKSQLRYLMTHQQRFALREMGGERLCGLAAWRERDWACSHTGRLQQLRNNPQGFVQTALPRENVRRIPLADLLTALFHRLGCPVELDDLVNIVADLRGVEDQITQTERDEEAAADLESMADARADVAAEVVQRTYVQQLWAEVRQLPPLQAAALLLNLRDAEGRGMIALLPLTGTADRCQIGETLALSAEQLAALWNNLPLEDAAIAQMLGVTRQQVINLRRVARERLARRMKGFDREA